LVNYESLKFAQEQNEFPSSNLFIYGYAVDIAKFVDAMGECSKFIAVVGGVESNLFVTRIPLSQLIDCNKRAGWGFKIKFKPEQTDLQRTQCTDRVFNYSRQSRDDANGDGPGSVHITKLYPP